jgi:starch phosphorylase
VGAENIFIFGLTAPEVADLKARGYRPRDFAQNNAELQATLALIRDGFFNPHQPDAAQPIVDRVLSDGEPFLVLADFAAYCEMQDRVDALYRQPDEWSRRAILNCLNMGPFSSDRSIRDYAENIWKIRPVI